MFKYILTTTAILLAAQSLKAQGPPVEHTTVYHYYDLVNGGFANESFVDLPQNSLDGVFIMDKTTLWPVWAEFADGLYFDSTNKLFRFDATTINYNSLANKPVLGTAASQNTSYFATASQGVKADNAAVASTVTAALSGKVDAIAGKGLSTNDYTSAEKTKLSGIATGATANSSDSFLLDRANHTGSQAISTVSGLQTALNGKFATPTGTTSQYVRGDGSLATLPAPSLSLTPAASTRSLNTAFQPAVSTKNNFVSASVKVSVATPLLAGGQTGNVQLQVSADGSTNWIKVGEVGNDQSISLAVSFTMTDAPTLQVVGMVPTGYYARIVTSGTGSFTYVSGSETPF